MFLDSCKTFFIYVGALLTSSPLYGQLDSNADIHQQALLGKKPGPIFDAPSGPDFDAPFKCDYSRLKGYKSCSSEQDRGCWLKGPGKNYDINTNYEIDYPDSGITREYTLSVDSMPINGDGVINPDGKVFNQSYPGPWIQACWGDTINVTVMNKFKQWNGTTIHWHGIRQLGTPEMDGVNGVTQCPIAPGQQFTYSFKAVQYGTSWYHSHYSLQYADGLAGPLTIYGPSSSNYDYAHDPILVTDWSHRSAFKDWQRMMVPDPDFPKMNSVLLNGVGNFAGHFPREVYNMTVTAGKKYLLRIINTSVDTTYIFSIDNHNLTVMSADFVPIKPYNTTNISIGIGQRYHVVLNAVPDNTSKYPASPSGNYWIRAVAADGCSGFEQGNNPDERQGILNYEGSDISIVPVTFRRPYNTTCRDEDSASLVPVLPWTVPPVTMASTAMPPQATEFDIGKGPMPARPKKTDQFFWWSLGSNPLWLDFSEPTLLNLTLPGTSTPNTKWNPDFVVIDGNYTADSWVYMVLTAPSSDGVPFQKKAFFPVAHPMHLHGHDFAILKTGNDSNADFGSGKAFQDLTFNNPPRRDVVQIVAGGYVIIAFKADNPGSWLMHCHIAWHASAGLALQILERQDDLIELLDDNKLDPIGKGCQTWDTWFADKSNLWDEEVFQDDAGI